MRLRNLLFVSFTVMATVPIVFLGFWAQRVAVQHEMEAVHEKHLLVARNVTAALSRYVTDVEAVFRLAADSILDGDSNGHFTALLDSFHFAHTCVVDRAGHIVGALTAGGESIPPDLDAKALAWLTGFAREGEVRFTGTMRNAAGEPRVNLVLQIGPDRFAIGALRTDYLVKTQSAIAFGKHGHAAIVDASGRVLAHPNKDWVASMKDISAVYPVTRMMAGETGVATFYSPAMNAEMVAGYTAVPKVGWGVMVPQPMAELEARTREVRMMTLYIMVLGIAIAGALSWWLAGRLASPLLAVARAARRSAVGAPGGTLALDRNTPTELRGLVESFNAMVAGVTRAEDALRSQSVALQATLDNMLEGITLVDGEQRLVLMNRRFEEMFAVRSDDITFPVPVSEFLQRQISAGEFGAVPDSEARVRRELEGFRAGRAGRREHVRPDGSVIEIRCNPLADGGVVSSYTDISERKQAERRIAHLARHDALTGLVNRSQIRERLKRALEDCATSGASCALHYVDLNQFKDINDTMGHGVGDQLLVEVASRLRECAGDRCTVGRVGGDEFAVVQFGVDGNQPAEKLARRIVDRLGEPYSYDGGEFHLGAAVGITLAPRDGNDVEVLYRNADLAMYSAKAGEQDGFAFFAPEMAERMRARKSLENDFRQALDLGQLALHYQPCVDAESGRVTATEALLRWNHPVRGSVPPSTFIPIAESTGLIVPIGEWVLRTACAYAASLHRDRLPPIRISVNLSAVQLRQANLVDTVERVLAETGLSGHRLVLEITESTAMHDVDSAIRTLKRLVALGISIAIDDFGAGHSSLGQLRRLPVNQIKMDRAFLQGLEEGDGEGEKGAIVEAVLGLGRGLRLPVIAEGVETEAQLRFLRDRKCAALQGYHIGRPMPGDAFAQWLAERNAAARLRDQATGSRARGTRG